MNIDFNVTPDIIAGIGDFLNEQRNKNTNDTNPYLVKFLYGILNLTQEKSDENYEEIVNLQDACLEVFTCLGREKKSNTQSIKSIEL